MSFSKEWFEGHLTLSKGWVPGSEKLESGEETLPVPADRYLTIVRTEAMGHHSKLHESLAVTWKHPDSAKIRSLLEEHGKLPKGAEHWGDYKI